MINKNMNRIWNIIVDRVWTDPCAKVRYNVCTDAYDTIHNKVSDDVCYHISNNVSHKMVFNTRDNVLEKSRSFVDSYEHGY